MALLPSLCLKLFLPLFALVCNMHHMSPGKLTMIRRNHVRQLSKRDFYFIDVDISSTLKSPT